MVCVCKAERARPPAHYLSSSNSNRSGAEHEGRKLNVWESDLFLINKRKQTFGRKINLSWIEREKHKMSFVMANR